MENQNTKENIGKILDYWYTIDFLGQDSFPAGQKYLNKMEAHKEKLKQGKEDEVKTKYLMGFAKLDNAEIEQTVEKQVLDCGMSCWGNITVYIGEIKRETCIKKLISRLGVEDNRPEESIDKIALASFQVTRNGDYVDKSLSLSPVLWAVKQIEKPHEKASKQLSNEEYRSSNFYYQQILAPKKSDEELYHIDMDDIYRLYEEIWDGYIKNIFMETYKELEIEKSYVIVYQMFVDEGAKKKYEDDTYTGLSKNYFSSDLEMLIGKNKIGELSQTMQDYILALYHRFLGIEKKRRVDVLHNDDYEEYELQLNHILRMKNAPLGKWPSRYKPALMQQVAINLLVGKDSRKIFKEKGLVDGNEIVFSVNGPPGTGKTTLLKEVVANNIVERAVLLAEYEHPDDAFSEKKFERGVYSMDVEHWYKLKNDRMNDYSILVASANNNAVENISKEFPIEKNILDDLKPDNGVSEVIRNQLDEISELFDVSKSEDKEDLSKGTYPDIYFTQYANNLLGKENAWGLIAAPLGKNSNKRKFYDKVLNNLLKDFSKDDKFAENRLRKYRRVREEFRKQYKVVEVLQGQLDYLGSLSEEWIKVKQKINSFIVKSNALIDSRNKELSELNDKLQEVNVRIELEDSRLEKITLKKSETEMTLLKLKEEREMLGNKLIEVRERNVSLENSVGFFARLFKTRKYKSVLECADANRMEGDRILCEITNNQTLVEKNNEDLSVIMKIYNSEREENERLGEERNGIQGQIVFVKNKIQKLKTEISESEKDIWNILERYTEAIMGFLNTTEDKTGIIPDKDYIQKIFSKDQKTSTQAQAENPWVTELYNREREKLFYYAVKLNKEFVLASNACMDNFKLLCYYWGYWFGKNGERIIFKESEESGFFKTLIQTLFLLVPVISSTFASVASFFRDVRVCDAVGLLIVDEAGQAQPHMAAGALYRARKAMVVGDPKQIEPVVTDDLKILKETFDEEIYIPYKEKNISVQLCADLMNPFGTFMDNRSKYPDWVGCPLLVHRRCLTPMFDISNELSYNGMMKKKTASPKDEVKLKFIKGKSQWIHVEGDEKGNRNHFVLKQGETVCKMLETAFENSKKPDVFVISPFRTVAYEMKKCIKSYCNQHEESQMKNYFEEWMKDNIGTVHTFQGKEANEVIFLLGCDGSKGASGAINWVNNNLVNVAVTRAKYRLYVVGDEEVWRKSSCMSLVQRYLKKEMVNSDVKDISCEV